MLEVRQGDILASDVEALVNTVNCVGVMGRGIALQFRKAFPDNYKAYKDACKRGELRPGKLFTYDLGRLAYPRYIVNFPTKDHWRGKSRLSYVQSGLESLVEEIRSLGIRSIAVPPLGCGLGGLEWADVRSRIEGALGSLAEVRVLLYEPRGAPRASAMVKTQKVPRMTVGRAALLGLMNRYLAALMDPFVSLLEIHKLMYFMQESGENLKLTYSKGHYGPYAENLRHVLNLIEGHFIQGYVDAEDAPDKQIELVPSAVERAEEFLARHADTQKHFDRVADLVEGFETPFGLELLATIHWVATREQACSEREVIEKTHGWSPRKRMFEPKQIRMTWKLLREKGWLPDVADASSHA